LAGPEFGLLTTFAARDKLLKVLDMEGLAEVVALLGRCSEAGRLKRVELMWCERLTNSKADTHAEELP
jgi:hypothetical protein